MVSSDAIFNLLEFMRNLQINHIYYRPCKIILQELPRLHELSIHALAGLCFVSPSTLSRLSRDLGYPSFQEFKITMIASYRYATSLEDLDHNFRTPREDSSVDEEVMALNFIDYTEKGIEQVRNFIKSGEAMKHVDIIKNCSKVMIFISDGVDMIPFARKMVTYGKQVSVAKRPDEETLLSNDFSLKNEDFSDSCSLINIHLEKETAMFMPYIKAAHEAGGKVILVCPDFFPVDMDLVDSCFAFDALGTIGDDIVFQTYLNALSIMF